jgi:hypothetical protein
VIDAFGRVTRFVIETTIEEHILKLQEMKQLVFEGHYVLSLFIDHTWNASCCKAFVTQDGQSHHQEFES